jgi:hypothetical protein
LSRRELQQMLETEKQQARDTQHSDYFAPAADRPYYIGILGLQPEDTFGIYTEPWGENPGPLSIVYRDSPEYRAGRRRYRQVVLGE